MGKSALSVEFLAEERHELEGLVRRRMAGQGLARRARIVLERFPISWDHLSRGSGAKEPVPKVSPPH